MPTIVITIGSPAFCLPAALFFGDVVAPTSGHSLFLLELSIITLGMPSWIPTPKLPDESVVNREHDMASMMSVFGAQPVDDDGMVRLEDVEEDAPRLDSSDTRGDFTMSSSFELSAETFF